MSTRTDLFWRFGTGADLVLRMAPGVRESGSVGSGNSGTKGTFVGDGPDPSTIARFGRIERILQAVGPLCSFALALAYGDAGALVTKAGMYPTRRWRAVASLTEQAQAGARSMPPASGVHEHRFASDIVAARARRDASIAGASEDLELLLLAAEGEVDLAADFVARAVPKEEPALRAARTFTPARRKPRSPEAVQAEEVKRDATIGPAAARYVHQLLNADGRLSPDQARELAAIEEQARALLTHAENRYDFEAGRLDRDARDVERTNNAQAIAGGLMPWQRGEQTR